MPTRIALAIFRAAFSKSLKLCNLVKQRMSRRPFLINTGHMHLPVCKNVYRNARATSPWMKGRIRMVAGWWHGVHGPAPELCSR